MGTSMSVMGMRFAGCALLLAGVLGAGQMGTAMAADTVLGSVTIGPYSVVADKGDWDLNADRWQEATRECWKQFGREKVKAAVLTGYDLLAVDEGSSNTGPTYVTETFRSRWDCTAL